jgi:hypothetical protein
VACDICDTMRQFCDFGFVSYWDVNIVRPRSCAARQSMNLRVSVAWRIGVGVRESGVEGLIIIGGTEPRF